MALEGTCRDFSLKETGLQFSQLWNWNPTVYSNYRRWGSDQFFCQLDTSWVYRRRASLNCENHPQQTGLWVSWERHFPDRWLLGGGAAGLLWLVLWIGGPWVYKKVVRVNQEDACMQAGRQSSSYLRVPTLNSCLNFSEWNHFLPQAAFGHSHQHSTRTLRQMANCENLTSICHCLLELLQQNVTGRVALGEMDSSKFWGLENPSSVWWGTISGFQMLSCWSRRRRERWEGGKGDTERETETEIFSLGNLELQGNFEILPTSPLLTPASQGRKQTRWL